MSDLSAEILGLIDKYAQGADVLRAALADFPADKVAAPLPPGRWSAQEVVCHLADMEIVYADRIQAVIAEDGPQIPARDENRYVSRLNYQARRVTDMLALIETVRRQITPLLQSLDAADFHRVGIHSVDGPLDLKTLLSRISGHVPHHADFIARKKQLLLKPA
jgi:hypothetical protein